MYKELAHGSWLNSVGTSRNIELYEEEILGRLDARQEWNELHVLTGGPALGAEVGGVDHHYGNGLIAFL